MCQSKQTEHCFIIIPIVCQSKAHTALFDNNSNSKKCKCILVIVKLCLKQILLRGKYDIFYAYHMFIQVRLGPLNPRWSSSLMLGVTAQSPEKLHLPNTAFALKRNTWIISGDSVFYNGVKVSHELCASPSLFNVILIFRL